MLPAVEISLVDMSDHSVLRDHLIELLNGGHAHPDFDRVLRDWPAELQGVLVDGLPHSGWQLLEHLRIAQWDILGFSRDPDHVSPDWPSQYWPANESPPDQTAWEKSVQAFRRDQMEMRDLVADPASDLFTPFPWGSGQTLLREAMLVADHNAYHLGQMVQVRHLLGCWPPG